jgi:HK97 family phage prohead protease
MTTENEKKQAFEVKRFAQPAAFEVLSATEGTFAGEGMVFDTPHPTSSWRLPPDWNDLVKPGAFTETLAAHANNGTTPLMLYMHERGNIPGVWNSIKETKKSLKLEGLVSKNAITPSGVPLLELMKMKAITGLSIGFVPTRVVLDEKAKVREIHTVDLGEVSIVDIPGQNKARITDVKRDIRSLEAMLRNAGLSKREAKALLSGGFEALVDGQDPDALALVTDLNKLKHPGETPGADENGRDATSNILKSISDFEATLRSA